MKAALHYANRQRPAENLLVQLQGRAAPRRDPPTMGGGASSSGASPCDCGTIWSMPPLVPYPSPVLTAGPILPRRPDLRNSLS
eukprot:7541310-Pyramimonas_sp.AAC.1